MYSALWETWTFGYLYSWCEWVWMCIECECAWGCVDVCERTGEKEGVWVGRRCGMGSPYKPLSFLWISAEEQQWSALVKVLRLLPLPHPHTCSGCVWCSCRGLQPLWPGVAIMNPFRVTRNRINPAFLGQPESHSRALAKEGAVMFYKVSPIVWTNHRTDFWITCHWLPPWSACALEAHMAF